MPNRAMWIKRGEAAAVRGRTVLFLMTLVLAIFVLPTILPSTGMAAGISALVPHQMDVETWHEVDRQHITGLLAGSSDLDVTVDALYLEWLEITRALIGELQNGAYLDSDTGVRVYPADVTARILALSLAKRAREGAIDEVLASRHMPVRPEAISRIYMGFFERGAFLGSDRLERARKGAFVPTVDELMRGLRSIHSLPRGVLRGFTYFIAPYACFRQETSKESPLLGVTVCAGDPSRDSKYAVIYAEPAKAEGWATPVHETAHMVAGQYGGPRGTKFWEFYRALRGVELPPDDQRLDWVSRAEENFAEDFRVVFSRSEGQPAALGAFPPMDEGRRKRFTEFVQQAVAGLKGGPYGADPLTNAMMVLDGGRIEANDTRVTLALIPGGLQSFITRQNSITITGTVETLAPEVKPALVHVYPPNRIGKTRESPGEWDLEWKEVPISNGDISQRLDVSAPGVHALYKGHWISSGGQVRLGFSSDPYYVLKLGPESSRLRDASSHWAKRDLTLLMSLGVIGGHPDGAIQPDRPVTRAEFVKMACTIIERKPDQERAPFDDTDTHWASQYVNSAFKTGWLKPPRFSCSFRPDSNITRDEVAAILSAILGGATGSACSFPDVAAQDSRSVGYLVEKGLIKGFPDGTFGPARHTTRAEAAALLMRLRKVVLEHRN